MSRSLNYALAFLALSLGLILAPKLEAQGKGRSKGGNVGGAGGINLPSGADGKSKSGNPVSGGGISIPGGGNVTIPGSGNAGRVQSNLPPVTAPKVINSLPGNVSPQIQLPNVGKGNGGAQNLGKPVLPNIGNSLNNIPNPGKGLGNNNANPGKALDNLNPGKVQGNNIPNPGKGLGNNNVNPGKALDNLNPGKAQGNSTPNPGKGLGNNSNPGKALDNLNPGKELGNNNLIPGKGQNNNPLNNNAINIDPLNKNPLYNAGKNLPNVNLGINGNTRNAFGINTGNAGVNALINQSLGLNVYSRSQLNNPAVRASINQNNFRSWNNYSNYGKYSWYKGPLYNNYGWYGGFGGLYFGLGSNYGLGGYGSGWGFGYGNGLGWGVSSLLYRCGYSSYYNPYYMPNYGGYNYAQPIYVYTTTVQLPQVVISDLDRARQAFKVGQYSEALASIDRAIQVQPNDPVLHEFRALVLFALGSYDQAAGTIHAVLAVGPGWDWATLVGFYTNVDVYTKQIRALEVYTDNNPQSASSRFYLAYLYQTAGHTDAAIRMLNEVVAINPKDTGAAAMLQMLQSKNAAATATAPAPEPTPTNEPNLNPAVLVGTWHATREEGRFDVTLNADQTFSWKFTQGQRVDEIKGTYASQGPVLVLTTKDQGSMAGKVTLSPAADGAVNEFQFQLVGGNPNDPGLKFVK